MLCREGDENVPGIVENMAGHTVLGVSCGDTQTICYTTTGDVYGWGCFRDKEGKKFFNPTPKCVDPVKDVKKQQNTPILIEKLGTSAGLSGIIEIACASSSCLARAEDGTVYSWGLGEQGQMSRGIHRNGSKTLSPLPSLRNKDGDYMLEDIYKYVVCEYLCSMRTYSPLVVLFLLFKGII